MAATPNPYAPPKAHVDDVAPATSEAEAIRREHIKHEASIKSVGVLYYISGATLLLGGLALFLPFMTTPAGENPFAWLGFVYVPLGALSLFVGRGIRTLRPWARTACAVLSGIGLLGFPIGTLINGYILYLLLSKKGKRIFESDYPAIVAATPHVKYRTSWIVWVVLAILLLVIALAIGVAVMRAGA